MSCQQSDELPVVMSLVSISNKKARGELSSCLRRDLQSVIDESDSEALQATASHVNTSAISIERR
jgi:hypothetical protein